MFTGKALLCLALLAAGLALSGCRLPGLDGPVPKALERSRGLSQKGVAAGERNQWDEAESLLGQAVRSCPTDSDARRNYAEALWNRGSRRDATAQLEEVLKLVGDDAAIHARLGEMKLAMGQYDAATQSAQKAIHLQPKQPTAWAVCAGVKRAQGNTADALAEYQRALAYRPDDRAIRLEVAECYRELNQPERALAVLQSLAETYQPGEEPPRLMYLEGLAYQAQGRQAEAIESFSVARTGEPSNPDVSFALAQAHWHSGHAAEAAQNAQRTLSLVPRHPGATQLLEQIQIAREDAGRVRR